VIVNTEYADISLSGSPMQTLRGNVQVTLKPATLRLSELPSRGRVPSQISVSGLVSGSLLGRISGMGIQASHLSLPLRYTVVMASTRDVIVKDPDILGGTPVFRGTRVPLQALFDSLEGGETLEEFLEGFPTVTREMAIAALEEAQQLLSGKS
jgi:uncharacterized protein (DUF433 family)